MESSHSLHTLLSSGLQTLDDPEWSSDHNLSIDEVRLPKKRRYCGEDMSRHYWDVKGMMSTEPPTPVLVEQQEYADEHVYRADAFPFYPTNVQRVVTNHHRPTIRPAVPAAPPKPKSSKSSANGTD